MWLSSLFENWTPANWIAFSAAMLSLGGTISNVVSTNRRERGKNRREELHRRVATPIEVALNDFTAISDELYDAQSLSVIRPAQIEQLGLKAKAAQRKLSRALLNAHDSRLCKSQEWNLGITEYDDLVAALEALRSASTGDQPRYLTDAIDALDRLDDVIREAVRQELHLYT